MALSCDRIVLGLRQRGVETDVAVFSRRHAREAVEQQEGGRVLLSPLDEDPGHAAQRMWNAMAGSLDLATVTHVVAFGGLLPLAAAPAFAAWAGCPLVTLLRGNDFDLGWFSPRRGESLRDAVARSACVCAVSPDHERKLASLVPAARVMRVPNGIDAGPWRLTDADRAAAQAWRAREVAPGRRVIGLFGHLKQKKGADMLIEAMRQSGDADRAHLLMVGEPDPPVRAALEAAGPALAHTLVDPIDRWQLLPYYAACDIIAIPSLYDGLPNVLLEAGALGIPVLASTAGGLSDLATDGDTAFTFAPGDHHACRRAIGRALEASDEDRSAMGSRLRTRVVTEFTSAAETEGYLHVLRSTRRASGSAAGSLRLATGGYDR